jgi:hypothetical protein
LAMTYERLKGALTAAPAPVVTTGKILTGDVK